MKHKNITLQICKLTQKSLTSNLAISKIVVKFDCL